jgi:hypothetical protein
MLRLSASHPRPLNLQSQIRTDETVFRFRLPIR